MKEKKGFVISLSQGDYSFPIVFVKNKSLLKKALKKCFVNISAIDYKDDKIEISFKDSKRQGQIYEVYTMDYSLEFIINEVFTFKKEKDVL